MNNNSISQLYVLEPDGRHSGPISMDALARRIVEGSVSNDVLVAPLGAQQWLHASQLPDVLMVVDSIRRASIPPPPPAPRPSPPSQSVRAAVAPMATQPMPPASAAPRTTMASPAAPIASPLAPVGPSPVKAAAPSPSAPPPAQAPAPTPAAAPAAAASPAPQAAAKPAAQPAAAPAAVAAPKAKPWPKHLSLYIFLAFLGVGAIETVAGILMARSSTAEESAETTPAK
jgi:hypothetical protein